MVRLHTIPTPRSGPWILLGLACAAALAPGCTTTPVRPVNTDELGVAIHGFDPVAYFTEGRPMPGDPGYRVVWRGAKWWFASAEHRDAFALDPERYAPRYGGYCAYAVALGGTADIDPTAWAIVDDRLYLNLTPEIARRWEADRDAYIRSADRNWPDLIGAPRESREEAGDEEADEDTEGYEVVPLEE